MESKKHEDLAKKLAKKFKTDYQQNKGVDIKTNNSAIEVEVFPETFDHGIKQLKQSRKEKKYIAVPKKLVQEAKQKTKGTGIGVMNENGQIKKRFRK